jgi:peptidoglycan hydrolase-like protein with peptidoglycan-binding domain
MKWFIVVLLIIILIVPITSGINYLLKNDLKIFRHPAKDDLKEEELLGSDEVNNFRVAQIQNTLKDFGYNPGVIDGRLGKNTREAIKAFQIAKGISPTGNIDSRTYFELLENPKIKTEDAKSVVLNKKDGLEVKPIVQVNTYKENEKLQEETVQLQPKEKNKNLVKKRNSKADLKYFQSMLSKIGFYKGKIDGIPGKMTRLAIKKYQKTRGLKADGILGATTKLCLSKEG